MITISGVGDIAPDFVAVTTIGHLRFAEFNNGHIKGNINIPFNTLSKQLAGLKKHKNGLITCCKSVNRSTITQNIVQSSGIAAVNKGIRDILNKKINQ